MKIGVTGAQGTGKSTLLESIRTSNELPGHLFCVETTRWVQSLGFDINEAGGDLTQLMIMYRHIEVMNVPNFITDRTVIDGYVYTKWLYEQGRVSRSVYDFATIVFEREVERLDYIFFIEPEFDLIGDGVRSTDASWRDSIHNSMVDTIAEFNIPVIKLTGSVEARTKQFLKTIKGTNNE
jgi:deoxyadenosine/deoxycytidine kinase